MATSQNVEKIKSCTEIWQATRGWFTWPDFDVAPPLRAVGGAGGDRRGGAGTERGEEEAEEQGKHSKRAAGPVHVEEGGRSLRQASARRRCGRDVGFK
jgi:hypothetical protein